MDKKTQMYVGVALLGVAGYMLWNKMKKDKAAKAAAPAAAPASPASPASFTGNVGERKRGLVTLNKDVKSSGWLRGADGSASIAPTFFDTKNSMWAGK